MPTTIAITLPSNNSTVGSNFLASGTHSFEGAGNFVIKCYLESLDSGEVEEEAEVEAEEEGGGESEEVEEEGGGEEGGGIEATSVNVNTAQNTWTASFSSVPSGSGYTFRANIRQGGTLIYSATRIGITVS